MICSNTGQFCFSAYLWACPCSPGSLGRPCLGTGPSLEFLAISAVKFPAHLRAVVSGGLAVPG